MPIKKTLLATLSILLFFTCNSDCSENEILKQKIDSLEAILQQHNMNVNINAKLSGIYKKVSGKGIYKQFEFIGKESVMINMLGLSFNSHYVIDGDFIRISTDKADILLKKVSNDTLVGLNGFEEGTYVKSN